MALAAGHDSVPVLLWGTAQAHICLGQSQSPALELVPDPFVPVVRRALGGGAVWVDEQQWCHVLVVPLRLAPRHPAEWGNWALQPAMATFRRFGLAVEIRDGDLWLHGRKIAGSGSATIGQSAVIASSYLLRFPGEKFARCIAGSAGFRDWLLQGLKQTMTDWASHAEIPAEADLRDTHVSAVEQAFGWKLLPSSLTAAETVAIEEAVKENEIDDWHEGGRGYTGGIKLNAESWLIERQLDGVAVREMVVRGNLARREIISA